MSKSAESSQIDSPPVTTGGDQSLKRFIASFDLRPMEFMHSTGVLGGDWPLGVPVSVGSTTLEKLIIRRIDSAVITRSGLLTHRGVYTRLLQGVDEILINSDGTAHRSSLKKVIPPARLGFHFRYRVGALFGEIEGSYQECKNLSDFEFEIFPDVFIREKDWRAKMAELESVKGKPSHLGVLISPCLDNYTKSSSHMMLGHSFFFRSLSGGPGDLFSCVFSYLDTGPVLAMRGSSPGEYPVFSEKFSQDRGGNVPGLDLPSRTSSFCNIFEQILLCDVLADVAYEAAIGSIFLGWLLLIKKVRRGPGEAFELPPAVIKTICSFAGIPKLKASH